MKVKTIRFTVLCLAFLVAALGAANAQNSCSKSIMACGCTITSSGTYNVNADLSASQGLTTQGSCIDVSASNVKLFTNGHNITGEGTGVGLHLLSDASTIFVSGTGPGEAAYSLFSSWQYAVESQASKVSAEGFYAANSQTGVLLKGAQSNNFAAVFSYDNSAYGVWIWGGSANVIEGSWMMDNGVAGIYIGSSASGSDGKSCSQNQNTSTGNFVFQSGGAGQNYGLMVQSGNTGNTLVDNSFSGDSADDMFDGNASGTSNLWHSNSFVTANVRYIQ